MAIISIVAIGQMLVILTGGIDISQGTGMGLVGMVSGLILINNWGINPVVAILMGAFFGAILGAINGLLVTKGGIIALIATLSTMSIFRGLNVVINLKYYGGQYIGADKLSDGLKSFTKVSTFGIPNLLIFIIIAYLFFYYFLNFTITGRQMYAVGSNPAAAKVSGINVFKIQFLPYLISGILFGIGGVLYLSRYATMQTDTGMGFEFITITAVVLGGVSMLAGSGSIIGVFFGSLLVGIINNALNITKISPFWKLAINGLILLLAVLLNKMIENKVQQRLKESRRIL